MNILARIFFLVCSFYANGIPEYSIKKFSSQPSKVIYFSSGTGRDKSKNILLQEGPRVWASPDEGKSFLKVDEIPEESLLVVQHPFDLSRAFVFTNGKRGFWTQDEGASWIEFSLEYPLASLSKSSIAFHAVDFDRIIVQLHVCHEEMKDCQNDAYLTLDSFKTSAKEMLPWTSQCEWAQSINADRVKQDKLIFCTQWPESERSGDVSFKDTSLLTLVASENYFLNGSMSRIPTSGGIPILGLTPNWLIGIVKSNGYHMIITKDGQNFVKSSFGGFDSSQFVAFSVLESSNSSLIVDVVSSRPYSQLPLPFGSLFVSSSDGTYFSKVLEHTNRDINSGLVDFEHIQASMYEGVQLANTVRNWEAILSKNEFTKKLTSYMSFNNGRNWNLIKPPSADTAGNIFDCVNAKSPLELCSLHLHSVTTTKNVGKVFSVSSSPGTIIGVGNVGPYLLAYEDSDTFISHDSGVTWRELKKGPHKFENVNFGSILVLIPDLNTATSELYYSKNGGQDWETLNILIDDSKWIPQFTTLDTNSTSLNMLMAVSKESANGEKALVQISFESVFSRVCDRNYDNSNNDIELFKLISPDNECVLGRTSSYYRRKLAAECYMDISFASVPPLVDSCPCSTADLECDNGFLPDSNTNELVCLENGDVLDQPLECKLGESYDGKSGYRLIPGNQCSEGDLSKLDPISKKCKKNQAGPSVDPMSYLTIFDDHVIEHIQIPKSNILIILTKKGRVWRSVNAGEKWNIVEVPDNDAVVKIITHEFLFDRIFLLTKDSIYITNDGFSTNSLELMKTPQPYNDLGYPIFQFHSTQPDWYIFLGSSRSCSSKKNCFTTVFITKDGGKSFSDPLDSWVSKCLWARSEKFENHKISDDASFCASLKSKDTKLGNQKDQDPSSNPYQLLLFNNGKSVVVIQDNILDFNIIQNVMFIATENISNPIIYTSIDGESFGEAKFPSPVSTKGVTILKSEGPGIFLDIAQSLDIGSEFGSLYKSNLGGDYFSKSLSNTNRGSNGKGKFELVALIFQVDFIKLPGISGIAFANVAVKSNINARKIIESRWTTNEGLTWSPIVKPIFDVKNTSICSENNCKLHLHLQSNSAAYHSMISPFGTNSSAGLMVAVGSIGEFLDDYDNCNMYITRDAGNSWIEVKQGPHLWAIANRGNILVLIDESEPITTLSFSWDFGSSWADFKFTDEVIKVESIIGFETSPKVIISGHALNEKANDVRTISILIDFSTLFSRICDGTDFERWTPLLDCFLGERLSLERRKTDSICLVSEDYLPSVTNPTTCDCSENDFECDSNFFRNEMGECVLTEKDPNQPPSCRSGEKYEGLSGYKKISTSKCTNGIDLSKKIERTCDAIPASPENVEITFFSFPNLVEDYFQFKNSTSIIVKDSNRSCYFSKNGLTWDKLKMDSVIAIIEDVYWPHRVFILAAESLWVSKDYGVTFLEMKIPSLPNIELASEVLSTHPSREDWLLWIGSKDCFSGSSNCRTILYVSFDSGKNWSEMDSYVSSCQWAWSTSFKVALEKTVLCIGYPEKNGNQRYLTDSYLIRFDYADSQFKQLMKANLFTVEGEYLVVAVPNPERNALEIKVSLDAEIFSSVVFPDNLVAQKGYTVLDSNTGNLFLSMIESINNGAEHGSIMKSDWTGTFYHKSLDAANINKFGFVDFEKIEGVLGTMIANQIANVFELPSGVSKKIQTKISFDDGENWNFLKAPSLDSENKEYKCPKKQHCDFLQLHAFTDRHDRKNSYSTPEAIGLLVGVGNVGEYLKDFDDGDTFLSRDGGKSWVEISKEAHMVEISDHGGVIVMVNDEGPISSFKYSLDSGKSLYTHDLSDVLKGQKFRIQNIISNPFGSSSSFILLGKLGSTSSSIHLDFSNVQSRKCSQNADESKNDFEHWNPFNQSCTFGANFEFTRRKLSSNCYIGDSYSNLKPFVNSCECTIRDYDCDQYHTWNENVCSPISNINIPEPACVNGFKRPISGYVKKKISQCMGGETLEKELVSCGEADESISWPIVYFIILPISFFSVYLFYLYMNGGLGRHGAIYLPLDTEPRSEIDRLWNNIGRLTSDIKYRLISAWVKVIDYFQNRSRNAEGYDPVSSYYDPDMPTQQSLELDWEDE